MRSGAPGACEGPRVYRFHGGAAEWTGCPRLSLGHREAEWLDAVDRADGRMSLTDLAHAPLLLVDVFDVLAELQAQAESHARAVKAQAEPSNPGTLR